MSAIETVVPYEQAGMEVLERVVVAGDLARLSPADRVAYYRAVCRSTGLNPLTKPFDYITLNGRLTLYATKTATDQLRSIRSISIDRCERDLSDPEYVTWLVTGHDGAGRVDTEIGSVTIKGLSGEAKANAIMKALTKGKRRLTLSLAGLGWLDEIEVASVSSAQAVDVNTETGEITQPRPVASLAEKVAARRADIEARQPDAPAPVPEPAVDVPAVIGEAGVSLGTASPLPTAPETGPASGEVAAAATAPSPVIDAPVHAGPVEAAADQTTAAADTDPDVRPCGRFDPVGEERCTLPMGHDGRHKGAKGTWK